MNDHRPPSDDELLDARLRAAAAPLADEPLPEGALDATDASAPRWRHMAPFVLAAAAGLLAITVGIGLSQVGPPTVSDASPSPSITSLPTPSPSAMPSEMPTPSPSPTQTPEPTPQPPTAYLVTGGSTCGDGAAGYSFMVPDGWYASRRIGDTSACSYLSDAPFDMTSDGAGLEVPVSLLVRRDPAPVGNTTEVDVDIGTETPDRFATRYAVKRDSGTYAVFVVPLIATIDGSAAYLHLQADESDADAVAAIERILERLVVREPLVSSAEAAARADALYAEVDGCINIDLGFTTAFPESWWTNTRFADVPGCVYLAPTSFEIPDDPAQVPEGVAITIRRVEGDVGTTFEEITGYGTLVVDRLPAVRWELGGSTYQVIVQLGGVPEFGPNLVLTTGADPLHRAVLDQVVGRLRVSPSPPEVVARDPLPSCGAEVVTRLATGDVYDPDARGCLWAAYEAGDPSEFVSQVVSVEGTTIVTIYRVIGPGEVEVYIDWTHDYGGTWQLHRCTTLDSFDGDDETIHFGLGECDAPIQLEASGRP
ncbi:MAG: hypothetical protein ACRDGD_10285 [Candidatus Limnocylindria bacterium]